MPTRFKPTPLAFAPLTLLLGGCNTVVLRPAGDVAMQQKDILLQSTWLMLIIILPVMALTAFFAWKYRHTNKDADYDPDWDHSTQLELVIWAMPLLIIICLGALTWLSTHLLDPYRPLDRLAEGKNIDANVKKLEIDVVALDWKWLFIYPQYGIASINQMAAPVDRPLDFHITASSVMNSFYIPALAGQIYAMAGMETRLQAVINQPGDYNGFSANYSGAGFSDMNFTFSALDDKGFDAWVAKAKAAHLPLSRDAYKTLVAPSEKEPVKLYSAVDKGLFHDIVTLCIEPGPSCMKMAKMPESSMDATGDTMPGMHNMQDMAGHHPTGESE